MLRNFAFAAIAAALVGGIGSVSNAAIAYNSEVTVNPDGTFSRAVPGFMQVLTLSTPNVAQTIDSFALLGIRYNANFAANEVAMTVRFYSNVDESGSSTDALASANLHGSVTYDLPANNAGSYLFTDLPVNVSVPGNKVGVSISLINKADLTYNLNLAPRLSVGLPSVGANDGFIYLDQNTNGTFAGSERFQETGNSGLQGPTNFRAIINATIPEPMSMMIVAPALIALRRRGR